MIMTCTYLNSLLLEAPRKYVLHGLDPGLDWASFWSPSPNVFLVAMSPSILLFVPMDWVSHLTPSLLSGQLLTNVQENNITTLHDTNGHTYMHHIGITILLSFYTSSTLPGRPAGPDPSHLTHLLLGLSYFVSFRQAILAKFQRNKYFVISFRRNFVSAKYFVSMGTLTGRLGNFVDHL